PGAEMSESIRDNPNQRLSDADVAFGDFAHDPGPQASGRQAVRFGDGVAVCDPRHGRRRQGAYLLRSNIDDWTDQQLWKAYIQLTQAEAAFRIQKDQLNLRPIWHQREDRVQAHILVCFLAFVLWKCLEMWQSRASLGNSPRTILEELARIQSHDVVLPTATHGRIRLRCVTQPDPAQ